MVHQNSNLLEYVDAGDYWSVAVLYEIQSLPCQRSHQVCSPDYDVSSVSLRILNSEPRYLIGSGVVGEGNMTCESKARVRGCKDEPAGPQVSYRGSCRVLTNHIAMVESHVVTTLPGTASKEPPASVIIAIHHDSLEDAANWIDILQVSCT